MATGYTAAVADGKVREFKTFALQCAHAFIGQLRDSSMDDPIPVFKPSDYHAKELRKAKVELEKAEAMTLEEAEKALAKAIADEELQFGRRKAENEDERRRYEAMLEQVRAWEPPSREHSGLKKFMIQQLNDSIERDCYDIEKCRTKLPETAAEFKSSRIKEAARSVNYHEAGDAEEIEQTAKVNEWVRLLKESIAKG